MRYSLRTLLLLIAGASICLALTNLDYRIGALAFVVSVIILAAVGRRQRHTPYIIYGGVLGCVLFVVLCLINAHITGELPNEHRDTASNTSMRFARRFAIPLGGGAGAFLGLVMYQMLQRKTGLEQRPQSGETEIEPELESSATE